VDNGLTFDMIEMSVRGHDVAATIAPFCHGQDGRGVFLALQSQHAGKAIYDQLVKDAENILKNSEKICPSGGSIKYARAEGVLARDSE
jgi:hypothetical protein